MCIQSPEPQGVKGKHATCSSAGVSFFFLTILNFSICVVKIGINLTNTWICATEKPAAIITFK